MCCSCIKTSTGRGGYPTSESIYSGACHLEATQIDDARQYWVLLYSVMVPGRGSDNTIASIEREAMAHFLSSLGPSHDQLSLGCACSLA